MIPLEETPLELHEDNRLARYRILGYDQRGVRVDQAYHAGSMVVASFAAPRTWPPTTMEQLRAEHLEMVLAMEPEVVILGTGVRHINPAPHLVAALQQHGVGIEVMNTAAACRTYNVLLADGRRVVACLLQQGFDADGRP
jgi:uncharacterized protein